MTLKARVLACALLGGALSQPTVCVSLHACHPLHTRACATHIDPVESCACMCACVCVCVCVYLCVCGQLPELETKKEESKAKIGRQQKEFEGQDRQHDLDIDDMLQVLFKLEGFEKKVVQFQIYADAQHTVFQIYTTQDTQGHV